jgi:hypothetical protein
MPRQERLGMTRTAGLRVSPRRSVTPNEVKSPLLAPLPTSGDSGGPCPNIISYFHRAHTLSLIAIDIW